MAILITGGTGLIGAEVARLLVEKDENSSGGRLRLGLQERGVIRAGD